MTLEIKSARSGMPVPLIDGVYLHSIYDPKKEADEFINKKKSILVREHVLVLGIGLGYHINSLKKEMERKFKEYQIMVLDPNLELVTEALEVNKWDDEILIIQESNVTKLYDHREFVTFLSKYPVILAHPPSFNLYESYFKSVLSFRSSDNIMELKAGLKSKDLIDYFQDYNGDLKDLLDYLKKEKVLDNRLDYLMLAFKQMVQDYARENI